MSPERNAKHREEKSDQEILDLAQALRIVIDSLPKDEHLGS